MKDSSQVMPDQQHPSSFRDPDAYVLSPEDGPVLRRLRGRAADGFSLAATTGLMSSLMSEGMVPACAVVDRGPRVEGILVEQTRIPFVTYPYEWSFLMLKAAAILHLDILLRSLQRGLILKDGSSYNVQFVGHRPVFIDMGSFVPYSQGQPWTGYADFCRLFLNPLLLAAYRSIPFQPWLRGSIEGISPTDARRALGLRDKVRPLALRHVVLQSVLQGGEGVPELVRGVDLPLRSLVRLIERLRVGVEALKMRRGTPTWESYSADNSYTSVGRSAKERFVHEGVPNRTQLVWDLGANTGDYSRLAAPLAEYVVGMEQDSAIVDTAYLRLRDGPLNVLPIVMDVTNPSPSQGWACEERQGLASRGPADIVLCLAILHHVRIAGNVPLSKMLGWLRTIGRAAIVEFVPKSDPMVRKLLALREDIYHDWSPEAFVQAAERDFRVKSTLQIPDSERTLYSLVARDAPDSASPGRGDHLLSGST